MTDNLHPGAAIAIQKLGMDELGIARAMAAGELSSPQHYRGLALFDLRITGVGLAYRSAHSEYVWRRHEDYLNDDFLARSAGLEIVWEHPKTQVLNSEEYANRIIGSIMLPYIKGDEVWGIARIRDAEAADLMEKGKLSTSPSVVLSGDRNTTVRKFRDGKPLLIEGKPELLDHLAICEQGVWDKGGEPTGVATSSGDVSMAETDAEKKAREDAAKARADAEGGEKLDQILEHLKLGNARLDAMTDWQKKADARMDAMDKSRTRDDSMDARRARDDAAAAKAFSDDDDAAHKKRMDAEEEAEAKELEEAGEPKEAATDKAKKHRADKDKFRDDRRRARDDARRAKADATAAECMDDDDDKKSDARMDAEEASEREEHEKAGASKEGAADAAKRHRADKAKWRADRRTKADAARKRADSDVHAIVQKALETRLPKPDSDEDRNAKADAQFRADGVFNALGLGGAPAPMQGETPRDYRLRLAVPLQKHSARWKEMDLALLPAAAFAVAETDIRNDAQVASRRGDDVPRGQFRERVKVDEATGMRSTEFVGSGTFIGLMKRPSQRATRFMLKSGS